MSFCSMNEDDDERTLYIDETAGGGNPDEDCSDLIEEDDDFTEDTTSSTTIEYTAKNTDILSDVEPLNDQVTIVRRRSVGTTASATGSSTTITPIEIKKIPALKIGGQTTSVTPIMLKSAMGGLEKQAVNITKIVTPKGYNITLIPQKVGNSASLSGGFIPILPKLSSSGNIITTSTITASGVKTDQQFVKVVSDLASTQNRRTIISPTAVPLKLSPGALGAATIIRKIPVVDKKKIEMSAPIKVKEIALKSKPCEIVKKVEMSPRSKQRSKSLTNSTEVTVSIVPDGKRKMSDSETQEEEIQSITIEDLKKSVNGASPVELPEDEEEEDEKTHNISSESDVEYIIPENDVPAKQEPLHEKNEKVPMKNCKPREVNLKNLAEQSPAQLLNWQSNVGILNKCRFKFEVNEFGIVEILEKGIQRSRLDIGYEKPINDRQSARDVGLNEPVYYCVGCHQKGSAVDFLGPVFCSVECLKRASKKRTAAMKCRTIDKRKRIPEHNAQQNLMNSIRRLKEIRPESSIVRHFQTSLQKPKPDRIFKWHTYLKSTHATPASVDLFLNPFPCSANKFEVGMKLEAIDPENNSKFCVCTIVAVQGYRLKLHFDRFRKSHDYWVNADSMDIFPPGWCQKTNRQLLPPNSIPSSKFIWSNYIEFSRGTAAPRHLFTHLNSTSSSNMFKIGMKLEADDIKNTQKICVATVADVIDNRILVHFDGWDEVYDYWIEIDSANIHPVNWHQIVGASIIGPPGGSNKPFEWVDYLHMTNSVAATSEMFNPRKPLGFTRGMKFEIVDRRNGSLIRPATVIDIDGYNIKVLFDGWSSFYAYWVRDDSPDIHPIGWADSTGHPLEPPPSFSQLPQLLPCATLGCRGIGNAIKLEVESHATTECCPYSLTNWNNAVPKPNRLDDAAFVNTIDEKKFTYKKKEKPGAAAAAVEELPAIRIKTEPQSDTDDREDGTADEMAIKENGNSAMECDEAATEEDTFTIAKPLLYNYGPRLRQNYELFCRNLSYILPSAELPRTNPMKWTVEDTYDYLTSLPAIVKYADVLRDEEIDGEGLLAMRKDDFINVLGLPLGIATKLYSVVIRLRCHVFKKYRNSLNS